MTTVAAFKIPAVLNEPNKHYAKGSADRQGLVDAVEKLKKKLPLEVPLVVESEEIHTTARHDQVNPSFHNTVLAKYSRSEPNHVSTAIKSALAAKQSWQSTPFADRAAIFLKAASLLSTKYRYEIMAATMLGQGKTAWQAEIDAAAELIDFLRFNVQYAEELYAQQPVHHAQGIWNRVEYRPLEGFVYAVTPFNFTAIAGNLPCAPALMGSVVLWKPSDSAILSNWLLYRILLEAGLPKDVIQFVPGDPEAVTSAVLASPHFGALHYTGSTAVFRSLYAQIGKGIGESRYTTGYPRIVGETGGKNFHLIHHSADIPNAVINTVRAAFEYSGQKCSACSRAYVPSSIWDAFRTRLISETKALKVGDPTDFSTFIGPVIHRAAFDRLKSAIDAAKNDPELELLVGGTYDDSKGFFIHPTIYRTTNPEHDLMKRELFGPILCIYVYPPAPTSSNNPSDAEQRGYESTLAMIPITTTYALTGAVFAQSRAAIRQAEEMLRDAAGNFYINVKCTGAVVGQQPFGGARASGTNDKAGSANLLSRFVSMRSVKEQFFEDDKVVYASNEV